jgi:hypothetical protein
VRFAVIVSNAVVVADPGDTDNQFPPALPLVAAAVKLRLPELAVIFVIAVTTVVDPAFAESWRLLGVAIKDAAFAGAASARNTKNIAVGTRTRDIELLGSMIILAESDQIQIIIGENNSAIEMCGMLDRRYALLRLGLITVLAACAVVSR